MYPTKEEAKKYVQSGKYKNIPISMEMLSDVKTPIAVLRILKKVSKHSFILESVEGVKHWGRYTFLGYDPKLALSCQGHTLTVKGGMTLQREVEHPREMIREILAQYKSPRIPGQPSFTGGFVGYFSYDYIRYSEPRLHLEAPDTEAFQDVDLMLFDKVIAFDNFRQKIVLVANAATEDFPHSYDRAIWELEQMKQLILNGQEEDTPPLKLKSAFQALFSQDGYEEMVRRGKEYIREGDIFQVVLSNRLEAEMEGSLLDAYRILRTTNPSPYMFYFSGQDVEFAGASPETLVKLENGLLQTFPLAGTRKRGETPQEDQALEKELLADEKELAEHNMLVDLGRNDIGRISRLGTVEVTKYMEIERYSHVMHIGSTVEGKIREDRDALDAIDAILPAGTLSGAPKLRACEIINELEHNKRGIYGGAIGYLDFTGNMDVCIAIRLAYAKNGKVFVRSGAGIVADSVPENEYRECIQKARAVVQALEKAAKGEAI